MFDTVLVANRGEIAVRVLRTLRRLGIRAVAVYSDADADARHVAEADEAYRIGPGPALESYLSVSAILEAAARAGADAVHPGYGFLSERAELARECAGAGVTFIGPPVEAIAVMGDKIRARAFAIDAGVPVVPGRADPGLTDDEIITAAEDIGFPVLLKPSAGGGGKGMHRVSEKGSLRAVIETARREAHGAFGDDSLFIEKWVDQPRHVEIQVLADSHGSVVHLGERECSLQRRHQKIVEEAPSPALDEETRQTMASHAMELTRRCNYVGAGTVEFVVPSGRPSTHFFLEMNTRLQVEHPVTELVTGFDLVELQVRVAAGERLPFTQNMVRITGHAVEARVYAEDPPSGFLPTGGHVLAYVEPEGPNIRVDSGLQAGTTVSTLYDPLLAKIVAWAPARDDALRRLHHALGDTSILGLRTNVAFLHGLLANPDVMGGRLDTGLVDRHLQGLLSAARDSRGDLDPDSMDALVVAAVVEADARAGGPRDDLGSHCRWDVADGWRLGEASWQVRRYQVDGGPSTTVRVRPNRVAPNIRGSWDVEVDAPGRVVGINGVVAWAKGLRLTVQASGRTRCYHHAVDGTTRWLGRGGVTWAVRTPPSLSARNRARSAELAGGVVRSPMPGTVVLVTVATGSVVAAGDPLVTVEAMKMEHALVAPTDGVVAEVAVKAGSQVVMDEVLVVVAPDGFAVEGSVASAGANGGKP